MMPTLLTKLNYRLVTLDEFSEDEIGVFTRNGEIRYVKFLGFIEPEAAKQLLGIPVKLNVTAIAEREGFPPKWKYLKDREYVQGCLSYSNNDPIRPLGAYCVIDGLIPRIVIKEGHNTSAVTN